MTTALEALQIIRPEGLSMVGRKAKLIRMGKKGGRIIFFDLFPDARITFTGKKRLRKVIVRGHGLPEYPGKIWKDAGIYVKLPIRGDEELQHIKHTVGMLAYEEVMEDLFTKMRQHGLEPMSI